MPTVPACVLQTSPYRLVVVRLFLFFLNSRKTHFVLCTSRRVFQPNQRSHPIAFKPECLSDFPQEAAIVVIGQIFVVYALSSGRPPSAAAHHVLQYRRSHQTQVSNNCGANPCVRALQPSRRHRYIMLHYGHRVLRSS